MSRSMGEKVAGERGEGVEGRGMQEEKEEEEARYDFSRREMDKDSWIEAMRKLVFNRAILQRAQQ